MKNIKETIIGVFAVIGFVAIISGFTTNNATQQTTYGTPESHVWSFHINDGSASGDGTRVYAFAINKQTGEVRKFETVFTYNSSSLFGQYRVASSVQD